jgi:hypothetical protein
VTTSRADGRIWAMRPAYRLTFTWLPWVWLAAVIAWTVDAAGSKTSNSFIFVAPFFIIYGLAFAWLSRFQVHTVRLVGDSVEFVAPARTMPMHLDDLEEIAPARGVLQSRVATRFRTERTRVTVLGRTFPDFDGLIAEIERRSHTTRVVRY